MGSVVKAIQIDNTMVIDGAGLRIEATQCLTKLARASVWNACT